MTNTRILSSRSMLLTFAMHCSYHSFLPHTQYVVAPSSSSGNWTEPTGGVFAKYQVSILRPSVILSPGFKG